MTTDGGPRGPAEWNSSDSFLPGAYLAGRPGDGSISDLHPFCFRYSSRACAAHWWPVGFQWQSCAEVPATFAKQHLLPCRADGADAGAGAGAGGCPRAGHGTVRLSAGGRGVSGECRPPPPALRRSGRFSGTVPYGLTCFAVGPECPGADSRPPYPSMTRHRMRYTPVSWQNRRIPCPPSSSPSSPPPPQSSGSYGTCIATSPTFSSGWPGSKDCSRGSRAGTRPPLDQAPLAVDFR